MVVRTSGLRCQAMSTALCSDVPGIGSYSYGLDLVHGLVPMYIDLVLSYVFISTFRVTSAVPQAFTGSLNDAVENSDNLPPKATTRALDSPLV